jgi:S-adenosylhomocysteine hydrolase
VLTDDMAAELRKRFDELKPIEGSIPAKRIALAEMLTKRRAELVRRLNDIGTDCETAYDRERLPLLNAEIVLLLIERGA